MLNIVLFGPPGAGKGTQAKFLVDSFSLVHLSTGDLLRNEIASATELGLKAERHMNAGELVPDSIVIGMIRNKIMAHEGTEGFIFDGFPRTVAQAEALDTLLNTNGTPITTMLLLDVPREELVNRLHNRGKVSSRPDDIDMSVIENRISVYHEKTAPLADYYAAQDKYSQINGIGTIENIAQRIEEAVRSVMSH